MRAIVLAFRTALAVSTAFAPQAAKAAVCVRVTLPGGKEHLECSPLWALPYAAAPSTAAPHA
ncbi:hypothetical protein [Neomegalonema sp.]|uniref:hypothetical protein n=1 Tax=Neomegalonema sp. TaxID=2039713 RepID=UPI0026090327|nr:hypothetical protein [Neomegalonema sp.]MDD2867491.1 hypothetical protein [Neomegalonema sp.]